MATEKRIGLLGCGRIARLFHLPLLQSRLIAVADPDPAALEAAAARVSGVRRHADWRELLEEAAAGAGALDAVVVCLPPAGHAAAAIAAFERGLHVYVEKPLALTLADARAVESAWRTAGTCGALGFNFRFNPNFASARERLASGECGQLISARTSFDSPRRSPTDWKSAIATGGGALRDLCVHHLDLLAFLSGEPVTEVSARARTIAMEGDAVTLEATLANGVPAQLSATQCTAHADNRVELLCEEGLLVAAANDPAPRPLERAPGRLARVERATRQLAGLTPRRLLHHPGAEPSFGRALDAFVATVEGRAAWSGADIADGCRVAALVDGIERADATART